MEIVSKPDLRTADEAAAYLTKLRSIVRYLGTCDGNMDEGSMRCDVNVSVRRPGGELGTRCEIKNVNSIRFVKQAIEYEARRQVGVIESGGTIKQETRNFDPGRGETRSLAFEGRRAGLSLLPRSGSAAADLHAGVCRPDPRHPAGAAGRAEEPLHQGLRSVALRRGRADRPRRPRPSSSRAVAKGRDAKQAANLGDGRFLSPC